MRKYWVDRQNLSSNEIELRGELWHHVYAVCKTRLGEDFGLICGDGFIYHARLVKESRSEGRAEIIEKTLLPPPPEPQLHLCLSLPRFNKIDFILEKSVELGVHSL